VPERENVKAVQADTQVRVVGGRHDPPGVREAADAMSPGESLEGDADAVTASPLGELPQLIGYARVIVRRGRRDVRADKQRVCAQRRHDRELGLGAAQVRRQLGGARRLEVAECLLEQYPDAKVCGEGAHLGRPEAAGDEVVLEDLHPVESGPRRCCQLLF
jgi:hypothetical protein